MTQHARAALAHALLDPLGINPSDVTSLRLVMASDGSTNLTVNMVPTPEAMNRAANQIRQLTFVLYPGNAYQKNDDTYTVEGVGS